MPDSDIESVIALSKEFDIPQKECIKFYLDMYIFLQDSAPQLYSSPSSLMNESLKVTRYWASDYRRDLDNR